VNKNKMLSEVAKHHKEWCKIVRTFGETNYTEDIVQEVYLRLHKYGQEDKIITPNGVNKPFVWFMLRNIYLDVCKRRNKIDEVKLTEDFALLSPDSEEQKHEAYKRLYSKINQEMDSWEWYDKMLFTYYKDTGMSLRQMSKATTISTRSIFNTIKHCKERLADNVGEDYQDYLNKDYELI
jgi:DNA-directed RNA polymerase specialized sigma24 family protein